MHCAALHAGLRSATGLRDLSMQQTQPARPSPGASALSCAHCTKRPHCFAELLDDTVLNQLDDLIRVRKVVKRGEILYRAGDTFEYFYMVLAGSFKTVVLRQGGREQIIGFRIVGELLGLEGVGTGTYPCHSVALEDSQICLIPFQALAALGQDVPAIQSHLHRLLGAEITRENRLLMLLGNMRAEERLAAFLLDLSERFAARGYSPLAFNLRMTREEIGNYLGLKMETISRAFSRFNAFGLISVDQKQVRIMDIDSLKAMVT